MRQALWTILTLLLSLPLGALADGPASGPASGPSGIDRLAEQLTQPKPGPALAADKKQQARDLIKKYRCTTCHIIEGVGGKIGPDLAQIGKKDKAYIKESLTDPGKIVAEGYRPQMPSLQGRITDAELDLMVEFLAGMK